MAQQRKGPLAWKQAWARSHRAYQIIKLNQTVQTSGMGNRVFGERGRFQIDRLDILGSIEILADPQAIDKQGESDYGSLGDF